MNWSGIVSLLEQMWNDDLRISFDYTEKESVFVIGKGQPHPVVKTPTDVGEESVMLLGGQQFFQSYFGESRFFIASIAGG